MTGGLPQNSPPGWSAKVFLDHAHYICSGELIAPRWVLTAGHCTFGKGSDYNYVHIRGVNIPVALTVTDPSFKPGPHTELAPSDVGLLELPMDVVTQYRASVLPLATSSELASFENRGVTIFGYGIFDNTGLTSPVLRKSPDGAWTLAPHCQVPEHVCFLRAHWATSNNIEPGDSGGPFVGWHNGDWRLLAVYSGHPYYHANNKLKFVSTPIAGMSPTTPAIGAWIASLVNPSTPTSPSGPGSGSGNPGPGSASPTVTLAQGPAAPAGYRYAISLSSFSASSSVSITCYDSVSPGGFYTFSLTTNSVGDASTASYCYSGDGPDHWVIAGGVESNHVSWGGGLSAPPPSPQIWSEQETPKHPVNTFTNYHNASGMGPAIAAGQWVEVSCKVYDPTIQSVNPDGYWYRIASVPWSNVYYSPANTFMNGDPYGGPYTHNTDFAVPNC
jgi:hypothetical protein